MKASDLNPLLAEVRACALCAPDLPHGPRPVLSLHQRSKILIVGQAPGAKVHASGVPWDDVSGERLRDWLGVDWDTFYDPENFGILPMGFCYPGKGKSGDLPPRKECAPQWHGMLTEAMQEVDLTLLVGSYAQAHYLGKSMQKNLTETVRHFQDYLPRFFPLVHPSPRNKIWQKRNPWFEQEVLPVLREMVKGIIA